MFEKWRIKEHMEVTDASGRHLGTVDSVDGDVIKLTRTDSGDGQHHYVDIKWVDKIEENRAWLSADAPPIGQARETIATGAATQSPTQSQGQSRGYDGDEAEREGFAGEQGTRDTGGDAPIFGTSGHGTGMGGSGTA